MFTNFELDLSHHIASTRNWFRDIGFQEKRTCRSCLVYISPLRTLIRKLKLLPMCPYLQPDPDSTTQNLIRSCIVELDLSRIYRLWIMSLCSPAHTGRSRSATPRYRPGRSVLWHLSWPRHARLASGIPTHHYAHLRGCVMWLELPAT